MQVSAKLKNLRISPRKVRLVADLIKGLDVADALNQMNVTIKRGNNPMKKLLSSAISNGENNFGLDKDNLYILDIVVGACATLKRWMPKAYGRAGVIRKRTSRIEIILEERIEGKGRKSKEEMAKEKQKRIEEKKKTEKAVAKAKDDGDEKETVKKEAPAVKTTENKEIKKTEKKGGIASKIFRRKSM